MDNEKNNMIMMLKLTAIYNAILLGWKVKVDHNKIIMRKKLSAMTPDDENIPHLIEQILEL